MKVVLKFSYSTGPNQMIKVTFSTVAGKAANPLNSDRSTPDIDEVSISSNRKGDLFKFKGQKASYV